MISLLRVVAVLLLFGGAIGVTATGAFSTVEAERTADVDVAGDANALLGIRPAVDPDESAFIQQSDTADSTFAIDVSGRNNAQLNTNATTTAANIFNITNNGESTVTVWIATQGGLQNESDNVNTTFYIDDIGSSQNANVTEIEDRGVSIDRRITTFDAFIDPGQDYVISEPEITGDTPGTEGIGISITPGQSVHISIAVEIDGIDPDSNQAVLNRITILAIADPDQSEAGLEVD